MSGREYSFRVKKASKVPQIDPNANIKDIILGQYDKYVNLCNNNPRIKELKSQQELLSKEITSMFAKLQHAEGAEAVSKYNEQLNHLTGVHKQVKAEYEDLLKSELSIVHQTWPDIFDKIIDGVDRGVLESVLDAFQKYHDGKISRNEGIKIGMDYMTNHYNLPNDFFNKDDSSIDKFSCNLEKMS